MRAVFLLPLAVIAAAQAACSDASFGLGEEDLDTGSDVSEDFGDTAVRDSSVSDSSTLETATIFDAGDAADTTVVETFADTADSAVKDVTPAETITEIGTDADADADAKPSRCIGKGILKDHVAVIFEFNSCCMETPPCCGRDSGYLAFKGSVDGSSMLDPYPGCTASTAVQNSLTCDFAGGKTIRFAVGVVLAPGMSLDHTIAASGKGTLLACKGDIEIGSCAAGSCTGALSPDTGDVFKLVVP